MQRWSESAMLRMMRTSREQLWRIQVELVRNWDARGGGGFWSFTARKMGVQALVA